MIQVEQQNNTPIFFLFQKSSQSLGHTNIIGQIKFLIFMFFFKKITKQERIQSNANHLLAESMGYIKFEGM